MTPVLKNLLILLVLLAVAAGGYYVYSNSGTSAIVTTGGSNLDSQAAFQTREFKRILNELNSISLDAPLLQDPNFLRLTDHAQPIVERRYGRPNPFSE